MDSTVESIVDGPADSGGKGPISRDDRKGRAPGGAGETAPRRGRLPLRSSGSITASRRPHGWNVGPLTKTYGNLDVAGRLREAWRMAGHASARAAAKAHDWAPSSVHGHERAERALTPEDLVRYAKAYGVDPGWIETGAAGPDAALGPPREPDPRGRATDAGRETSPVESARRTRMATRTGNHFMGFRLGVARRLAGFRTASAACAQFGFVRSTYGGHEYGLKGSLPAEAAEAYGAAFGVPAAWLLLRGPPAGLPEPVAAEVAQAEARAPEVRMLVDWDPDFRYRSVAAEPVFAKCAAFADPRRRGDPETVGSILRNSAAAREAARSRSRIGRSVTLREMPVEHLRTPGSRASGTTSNHWSIPADFMDGARTATAVVAVLSDHQPALGLGPGDRILVEMGGERRVGDLLVQSQGCLRIERVGMPSGEPRPASSDQVLGRVLAIIRRGVDR